MSEPDFSDLDVIAIDDHPQARAMIEQILRGFGVGRIRMCASVAEAREQMALRRPDVILTDQEMSPVDGIAFLRDLRRRERGRARAMPVIMLTAHTQPHQVRAAIEAGASHVVAKPIVPARLHAAIARFVTAVPPSRPAHPPAPPQGAAAPEQAVWELD